MENVFKDLEEMMENGEVNEVEAFFNQLTEEQEDEKKQWTIQNLQASLYEHHNMFLKMDKIGKELCDKYPSNYQGYHIRYQALKKRNKLTEMELLLKQVPEDTKRVFPYVIDVIECFEIQHKYQDIIDYVSNTEFYSEEAELYAWKQKVVALERLERFEEAEKIINKIALEYGDLDALIFSALLLAAKQQYDKARQLAEVLLQNLSDEDVIYQYYAKTILTLCDMVKYEDKVEKYNTAIDELISFIKEKKLFVQVLADELEKVKK